MSTSLRVVFFGTGGDYTMQPLLSVADYHQVVGIVQSAPRNSSAVILPFRKKVAAFWSILWGHSTLYWTARQMGVPFFYLSIRNMAELRAFLEELQPDVGCIASMNQLLPEDIIRIPRLGIINFHPALLPLYRGPNAWFWHYHQMEKEGGATIHFIDKDEDTGDILKQVSFPIEPGMDPYTFMHTVINLGARLMVEVLNEFGTGTAKPIPQRHLDCPLRARYLRTGEDLFDWQHWSLEQTYHFLQGTYLWYRPFNHSHGLLGTLPWRAVGYVAGKDHPEGKICLDWKGAYFAHPQGKIRLRPVPSTFRVILLILLALAVLNLILMRLL